MILGILSLALTLSFDCREALRSTIKFYDSTAPAYAERHSGTSPNVDRLRKIFMAEIVPGGKIVDAGCGPGRDIKFFRDWGFQAEGFDASNELVREALKVLEYGVTTRTFQTPLPAKTYHGIWAMASLIHVPEGEMLDVLKNFYSALKPGGLLMVSLISGVGTPDRGEFDEKGRFFNRISQARMRSLLGQIPGFKIREDLSYSNADDYHGANRPSSTFGFYNLFVERTDQD